KSASFLSALLVGNGIEAGTVARDVPPLSTHAAACPERARAGFEPRRRDAAREPPRPRRIGTLPCNGCCSTAGQEREADCSTAQPTRKCLRHAPLTQLKQLCLRGDGGCEPLEQLCLCSDDDPEGGVSGFPFAPRGARSNRAQVCSDLFPRL